MSEKNKNINDTETPLGIAMFGGLLFITILFLCLYLPSYMFNHPPVCKQEVMIKEIISIKNDDAKVKLLDGTIITQSIISYDPIKMKFTNRIKVNENSCVKYESLVDYYLAYLLL